MSKGERLRAVRAIVRPDRRAGYLEGWRAYERAAEALGAEVRLYEDEVLPGRFVELTTYTAAPGMESKLAEAYSVAELRRLCVRREGDDQLYREVGVEPL